MTCACDHDDTTAGDTDKDRAIRQARKLHAEHAAIARGSNAVALRLGFLAGAR